MAVGANNFYYGQQWLDADDYAAVSNVLHRRYISQGPSLKEFQDNVAAYCGAAHCIAVSSGTAGLQMAYMALGVAEGEEAWTTALTFVATANAVRFAGGRADFIDIDLDTFNIDLNRLEDKLKVADKAGRLPKLVVPVHFAGQSVDMTELNRLSEQYGFAVVEDACHALGGSYANHKIGSCSHSKAAVFSLHPVKSITTGEGGLILTQDDDLAQRLLKIRSHGLDLGYRTDEMGPWHREMVVDGANFRLAEFQCALGVSQMKKLDRFIAHRTQLAERYRQRLEGLPLRVQRLSADAASAWHLMIVLLDLEKLSLTKRQIFDRLEAKGVHLSIHYYPVPLHKFYRELYGYKEGDFPQAEEYYRRAFTLPLHFGLSLEDVDYVCDTLIEALS